MEDNENKTQKEYLKIFFEYTDFEGEYAVESAWAECQGRYYELSNILFYARGYSLGDIVKAEDRNGELYVTDLVEDSGHSTIRILFHKPNVISDTREELKKLGCDSEISNISVLISVDVPKDVIYAPIKQYLDNGEKEGLWGYEEACLAHDY